MGRPNATHVNKAATSPIVELFVTGDLSPVARLIAPDYLDHQGLGGCARLGPDGFREVVAAARSAWPNLRVVIEDLVAEGDRVAVRLRWHGADRTGTRVDRETIELLLFVDGRAVEHWGMLAWKSNAR